MTASVDPMAEEALEIVRGIYCRTLRLDPDLLVALAEFSGPDTEFDFTDAPNRYGLPPFYSLHAWIWKDNPAGAFEMWNPSVHCDET